MRLPPQKKAPPIDLHLRCWAIVSGLFIAIALLKFGTPHVLDYLITTPNTSLEWLFFSWPIPIAYALLVVLGLGSIGTIKANSNAPRWLLLLPALWLGWQLISTANTMDLKLTRSCLAHFTSALTMFYLGYFALSRVKRLEGFRIPLLIGFSIMIWKGAEQHFGGLAATRAMIYAQPGWEDLPKELLERVAKGRIFSTMFYPNTLAGALIMLTPICGILLWQMTHRLQIPSRIVIVTTLIFASFACLFWTDSRSGWLLCLGLIFLFALQSSLPKWIKGAAVIFTILGLLGFYKKHADYFKKGASSLNARFDYWRAAWTITKSNPILGSGPGTFMKSYSKIKSPDAEMTRLAHNDYLQQASDSGFLGALFYIIFIVTSMVYTYMKCLSPMHYAIWFGLLGFVLQSFVEFGLYIPSMAWSFFILLGWLLGQEKPHIKPQATTYKTTYE